MKKELATEDITNHMYETINACRGYENCQGQSVIFTPTTGRGKVKNNKKIVNDSVHLF